MDMREDERLDEVNGRLSLLQKKRGMTFGTDALLLAAFVKAVPNGSAIELGAGCGIISLLCAARKKFARIECVEIQTEYADLCERNVRLNGLSEIIRVTNADLRRHDLYGDGDADVIFANPPYMKPEAGFPSDDRGRNAARHETAGGIEDFCAAAAQKLKWGGVFSTVWRPDRAVDLLCALKTSGLEPKKMTLVAARVGTAPSMMLTQAKKGAAAGLILTPVFYLENGDGEPTSEARTLYETGVFPF